MSKIGKLLQESQNPQERLMDKNSWFGIKMGKDRTSRGISTTQKRVVCPFF